MTKAMTKLSLMKSSIDAVVKKNNKFLELRDMLTSFVKLIPEIKSVSGFMREVDKQVGEDDDELASTVQRLLPRTLPFVLGATLKTVTLSKLFKRTSLLNDALFKDIAAHLAESARDGEEGAIIFKVKNNGIFVAHTVSIAEKTANAIVITAKKEKFNNIYIEPLKGFMEDLFGIQYEEED